MIKSYNGWALVTTHSLAVISVPGCADTADVLAGDVAVVLGELALRLDAEVEPAISLNGWRSPEANALAGGDPSSPHLSGTALDYNGAGHPWEKRFPHGGWSSGWSTTQVAKIRSILADLQVVTWGLDFPAGTRDPMHFEIRRGATPEQVAAAATQIRASHTSPPRPPEDDDMYALLYGRSTYYIVQGNTMHPCSQADYDRLKEQGRAGVLDNTTFVGLRDAMAHGPAVTIDYDALAAALAKALPSAPRLDSAAVGQALGTTLLAALAKGAQA